MLLLNLYFIITLAKETENLDTMLDCLMDTVSLLKSTVSSREMNQTRTKKFIKKASKHMKKIFDFIKKDTSFFVLEKAFNQLSKTDKNIEERYEKMSLNEIQTKLDDLNMLLSEGDLKLIDHFKTTSELSNFEKEEIEWNNWKKIDSMFEKKFGTIPRYHAKNYNDLDEAYSLLNMIQDHIEAYSTLLSFKFLETIGESSIDDSEVVCYQDIK